MLSSQHNISVIVKEENAHKALRLRELEIVLDRNFGVGGVAAELDRAFSEFDSSQLLTFRDSKSLLQLAQSELEGGSPHVASQIVVEELEKIVFALKTPVDTRWWRPEEQADALLEFVCTKNHLKITTEMAKNTAEILGELFPPNRLNVLKAAGEKTVDEYNCHSAVSLASTVATLTQKFESDQSRQVFHDTLGTDPHNLVQELCTETIRAVRNSLPLHDKKRYPLRSLHSLVEADRLLQRVQPDYVSVLPDVIAEAQRESWHRIESFYTGHRLVQLRAGAAPVSAAEIKLLEDRVGELLKHFRMSDVTPYEAVRLCMLLNTDGEIRSGLINIARSTLLRIPPDPDGDPGAVPMLAAYSYGEALRPLVFGRIGGEDCVGYAGDSAALPYPTKDFAPDYQQALTLLLGGLVPFTKGGEIDPLLVWDDVKAQLAESTDTPLVVRPQREDVSEPPGLESVTYEALHKLAESRDPAVRQLQWDIQDILKAECIVVGRNVWMHEDTGEPIFDQGIDSEEKRRYFNERTIDGRPTLLVVGVVDDPWASRHLLEKFESIFKE